MGWFDRMFGASRKNEALAPYTAVVALAREPHWYVEGAVPDTVDGRFDMIAAVLTMLLLRLETERVGAGAGARVSVQLAERFVDDMDAQLRQIGVGDIVVGKHIGKMMAMLGGRLGAYRDGLATGDLAPALERNLYRGAPPAPAAVAHSASELIALRTRFDGIAIDRIVAGELA